MAKVHRKRVRLDGRTRTPEQMSELSRRGHAKKPRDKNGRKINANRYKGVLEGHEDVKYPGYTKTYGGQSSKHRLPAFVLQPSLEKRIVKLIKKGYPYMTVCNRCGISSKTFIDWLEKGKAGQNEDYVRFYKSVAEAEAKGEMGILKQLRRHAGSDWRVSAWQLERMWPEKYGRVDRIRAETRATISVTSDRKDTLSKKVVDDSIARELARKLIDENSDFRYADALPAPKEEIDA